MSASIPALPVRVTGFEWWSNDSGSLTIDGEDAVNVTIQSADSTAGRSLSLAELDSTIAWIVTVINNALAARNAQEG